MAAQVQSLAADGEPHDPEETICIVDGCGGAYSFDPIDSSVARYINRDLARDALHVLEAIETLGSPANEETIHHVKVVCADGEIRAALDAIADLLPRLRTAAEVGESAAGADALARVLATAEAQALSLDREADRQRLLELVAGHATGAPARERRTATGRLGTDAYGGDGDSLGPDCRCEPGRIDPECHHADDPVTSGEAAARLVRSAYCAGRRSAQRGDDLDAVNAEESALAEEARSELQSTPNDADPSTRGPLP